MLHNLGIESQWGQKFPHPSRLALGPFQPPVQWVLGLFPGVKWTEYGLDRTTPSSTKVKERAQL